MMKIFLCSLVVGLSMACSMSFTKETNSLVSLLKSYDKRIPNSECVYILRSNLSCKGCVQRMFYQIDSIADEGFKIPMVVLATSIKDVPPQLLDKITFVEDVKNEVMTQFIWSVNLTLIRTKEGEVIEFKVIETTDPSIYPKEVADFFQTE